MMVRAASARRRLTRAGRFQRAAPAGRPAGLWWVASADGGFPAPGAPVRGDDLYNRPALGKSRRAMRCFRFASCLLAVSLLALVACEKEQESETKVESDAGIDKNATLDPELAKAVAAASAGIARGPAAASSSGPPPNGIFPPGRADKEIKRGDPPKITLGGQGSEPRVVLGPAQPKPGMKLTGTIEVVQSDPGRGGLPIEFSLRIEAKKGDKSAADAGAAPAAVPMLAQVVGARAAVAGVPRELDDAVAKLKGAKVEYEVLPDGSGTNYRYDIGGATPEFRDMMRMLSDTIALVTLPMPAQPVGKGAFWMATSREGVLGLDLVTYRMVKVEELAPNKVTLSVGTKRYATSDRFELDALPPDAPRELAGFEAKSEGRVEFVPGTPFPLAGQVGSLLAAQLGTDPQKAGTLQLQSRAGLSFQPAK